MKYCVHRLALLSDAASLATQLETRIREIESWLDDINAEDSLVSTDDDLYTDVEKLKLQRHSVTVKALSLDLCFAANGCGITYSFASSLPEWWDAGVVICLGQGADLHMAQLMPLPLTISCSGKSRFVLPFCCQLTRVVPDKIQQGRKMVVCVCFPLLLYMLLAG